MTFAATFCVAALLYPHPLDVRDQILSAADSSGNLSLSPPLPSLSQFRSADAPLFSCSSASVHLEVDILLVVALFWLPSFTLVYESRSCFGRLLHVKHTNKRERLREKGY